MKKDFLARPVELHDSVIITAKRYKHLVLGRIVKITPQQLRIGYMNTWNYGNPGKYEEHLVYPGETVKVDGPELTMYLLRSS